VLLLAPLPAPSSSYKTETKRDIDFEIIVIGKLPLFEQGLLEWVYFMVQRFITALNGEAK